MDPATEMSPEERKAVKEVRDRVQDLLPYFKSDFLRHDLNILRFVRGRDLNVTKAEAMLRKAVAYRLDHDMDNVLSVKISPSIEIDFPSYFAGRDKQGFVVGFSRVGKFEIRKNFAAGLKDEMITHAMQHFESALSICEHLSTPTSYLFQFYGIVDCEGFRLREVATKEIVDTAVELTRVFESCCPEVLRSVVVINVPTFWELIWTFVKPMLSPKTISKITIYGSSKAKWKEHLLRDIDPDQLPAQYGGAVTYCPPYRISLGLDAFPKIHKFPLEDFSSVTVEAGESIAVDVPIDHIGTKIAWNFKTKDYDIAFQLDFSPKEGEEGQEEKLVENIRVDSHIFVQKGLFVCEKPGMYTLTFDNGFSTWTAKELEYIVRVCAAGDAAEERWRPPKTI